jgi:hypothetical protein
MVAWQEKSEGRIGNTAELFDAPGGHFSRSPKGRGRFARWLCRSSLMGYSPHRSSLRATGQNAFASRPF